MSYEGDWSVDGMDDHVSFGISMKNKTKNYILFSSKKIRKLYYYYYQFHLNFVLLLQKQLNKVVKKEISFKKCFCLRELDFRLFNKNAIANNKQQQQMTAHAIDNIKVVVDIGDDSC